MSNHRIRRRLRFAVRATLISAAPTLYWRFREWRRGDEEPELGLLPILCAPGRLAVDVGANYGMYTARLVSLPRRCVVFEPIPYLAKMLRRGFRSAIDLRPIALSDQCGTAILRVPDLHTGHSTLSSANGLASLPNVKVEEIEVAVSRLDDQSLVDVGFIKIDVEGHEEAVLRGAERLLRESRPNLLVEVEDRHNAGAVRRLTEWMDARDYAALVIQGSTVHRVPEFDLSEHQATTHPAEYVRNVIFTPKNTAAELRAALAAALRASPRST
jgi:FkbM family methyltransferase